MNKLQVGDRAPEFQLKNQDNKLIHLSDFKGKKHIVLYFYPKDETPGCTIEACSFRDNYEIFLENDAEVIGISNDSVKSHKGFQLKRNLPFLLLSDPKGAVRKLYKVSKTFMGLILGRETFLIDKEGIIQYHFSSQLQIHKHINNTLRVLKSLQ